LQFDDIRPKRLVSSDPGATINVGWQATLVGFVLLPPVFPRKRQSAESG
jgi:hypothetical protein